MTSVGTVLISAVTVGFGSVFVKRLRFRVGFGFFDSTVGDVVDPRHVPYAVLRAALL
jgi:hypothetical protein